MYIFERILWKCPLLFHVPSCIQILGWLKSLSRPFLRREILRVRGVALELITEVKNGNGERIWRTNGRGMIWYTEICWNMMWNDSKNTSKDNTCIVTYNNFMLVSGFFATINKILEEYINFIQPWGFPNIVVQKIQVRIQPHTVDFYEAVRQSGREVHSLLTESLARFSCLTEAGRLVVWSPKNQGEMVLGFFGDLGPWWYLNVKIWWYFWWYKFDYKWKME